MVNEADALLTSYEEGRLTRRQLLLALAGLAATAPNAAGQQPAGVVRPTSLDHVSLHVSDPARTEAFYRTFFGFPPARAFPGNNIVGFDLQGTYFTFQKGDVPKIDHFCVAVDGDYDIKKIGLALEAAGQKATTAGGGTTGYILDPDGIRVQLWPASNRLTKLPFPSSLKG